MCDSQLLYSQSMWRVILIAMNKYIAFILMTGCFFSCTHTHTGKDKIVSSIVEEGVISSSVPQKLTVRLTEDIYDRLETVLQPVSYVKLSNTPLLGRIKKVCIIDEHIFVWDVASGIVCYDMSGKFLFLLNARGQGPGEYTDISAFTINTHLKELVIYDNAKQTLMFYSAKNGKFLRSEQFNKPAPTEMAYFGGYFLYNNRLHRNYQDDVSLHYSLLASKDGIHIDHRYFKHQEREEQYPFSVSMRNLHDNYSKLYYCRDFDNIIYQVDEDSVIPRFQVELPQPVPNSKIEERPDEMKLLRSGYSLGITDIYQQKKEKEINVKYEEYEATLNPSLMEVNYEVEKAVEEAFLIGKKDNIFMTLVFLRRSPADCGPGDGEGNHRFPSAGSGNLRRAPGTPRFLLISNLL